ncbi:hypothetical protein COO60DRAFT_784400 [Scenedesmus sp. NREL 46B-D3]|nr:hypothetical protein COO60DRAFT_784400 [Scenedesmus sp. NREL 46B-D3]
MRLSTPSCLAACQLLACTCRLAPAILQLLCRGCLLQPCCCCSLGRCCPGSHSCSTGAAAGSLMNKSGRSRPTCTQTTAADRQPQVAGGFQVTCMLKEQRGAAAAAAVSAVSTYPAV